MNPGSELSQKEKDKIRRAIYYARNIEKIQAKAREQMRQRRLDAPDRVKEIRNRSYHKTKDKGVRKRRLNDAYGITPEHWDSTFEKQGRCCAICSSEVPNGKNWHTDHNHETKLFRGILCGKCNVAIGMANDNPSLLRKMANYLEASLS